MIGIKIPWQVFACAGLMALLGGAGYYLYDLGRDHKQLEWDAAIARGTALVNDLKAQANAVTTVTETVYVDRVQTITEKGKIIREQIPIYIPSDSAYLPGGFRLLHDAAASNTIPSPTGIPDAAPVGVAEATATITGNYEACLKNSLTLESLQTWVRKQREVYLEICKRPGVDCSTDN